MESSKPSWRSASPTPVPPPEFASPLTSSTAAASVASARTFSLLQSASITSHRSSSFRSSTRESASKAPPVRICQPDSGGSMTFLGLYASTFLPPSFRASTQPTRFP